MEGWKNGKKNIEHINSSNLPIFQFSIVFAVVTAICILASCSSSDENLSRHPLARVNNSYLYKEDVASLVMPGMKREDSAEIVSKYIDNWIHDQLALQKAEENLTDSQKNVQKQLDEYRKSLILYAYQKELVKQKLDTVVSGEDIQKYYDGHKESFELKDNILRVVFVKVKKDAPKMDKLRTWYRSENPKDRNELLGYCRQFASNFYLDDNTWLLFDDVVKEIPIKMYDQESFLQNNRFVEVSDSAYNYFVNIKGFMIKNSTSPIAFEKDRIKSIIINKRKLELINKMKEEVYNEAVEKKQFEIYK